ncbi:MAG: methylmalonyl Co-A mutase-associated GTPase MeaB [Leptonema sp. (in: Bacteria)]|nr:methylmalonyl Co-A mutase-associated GTPase MeaB [Leptonema sp. (in: bacteria)]
MKRPFDHDSSLEVKAGVELPPSINPNLKRRQPQLKPTLDQLIDGIQSGDRVLLSRAITLVESDKDHDRALSHQLINSILPLTGNSLRIGITGVPGVGKSTFIEAFGVKLAQVGHKVAVLAVDPTSERSGGSILGDKTRMEALSREKNAYIRPTASGATLGGVARRTRETILLVEAAGFDRVLIETVGVGQSEVMVHSMVDMFLFLALAGAGDELQGMKRGIMEMADAIVITKADGDNINRAKVAAADMSRALNLFPKRSDGWQVAVKLSSAITGDGLDEVITLIEAYNLHQTDNRRLQQNRKKQALYWMQQSIDEKLKIHFESIVKNDRQSIADLVESGELNPFDAADRLIKIYEKKLKEKLY